MPLHRASGAARADHKSCARGRGCRDPTLAPRDGNGISHNLVALKEEWVSEYRYHDRGICRDYIGIIVGIHSPTLP